MVEDEPPIDAKITFHTDGAADALRAAIQRVKDLTAFGFMASQRLVAAPPTLGEAVGNPGFIRARGDNPDAPLSGRHLNLVGSRLIMPIGPSPRDSLDDLRADFDTRLLASAFQECVRALATFLLDIRNLARLAADLLACETLTVDEYYRLVARTDTSFDFMPFEKKLSTLARDYGIMPDLELSECIGSFTAARNCLEHRNGIVGLEDTKKNAYGVLVVKWRRIRMVTASGKEIRPGDSTREEFGAPQINVPGSRLFQFGERVAFTQEEFSEICWTFSLYAQAVAHGLSQYLGASGVTPESAAATPEPGT